MSCTIFYGRLLSHYRFFQEYVLWARMCLFQYWSHVQSTRKQWKSQLSWRIEACLLAFSGKRMCLNWDTIEYLDLSFEYLPDTQCCFFLSMTPIERRWIIPAFTGYHHPRTEDCTYDWHFGPGAHSVYPTHAGSGTRVLLAERSSWQVYPLTMWNIY